MQIRDVIRARTSSYGIARTHSASLQLSSSSGRSHYLEYAGDPARNDHHLSAPTKQYKGHDDAVEYRHSREDAQKDLDLLVSALDVPELRDEFVSAVAKIARKASQIKHAASNARNNSKPDGVTASRLRERWAGNALFELEVRGYEFTDQEKREISREVREIVDELGLREKFGYTGGMDFQLPSYHEINKLYHQMKKASRIGETDAPNP